ncbi:hypothetical protein BH18ACT4_BH18ACT4_14450 [soil metagenome]
MTVTSDETITSSSLDFVVSGMTCGSCAARVEKVLGRQPGVTRAGVNFATGRATVVAEPGVAVEDLTAAVDRIGYGLAPVADEPSEADEAAAEADEQRVWLRRVLLAWPLAMGVMILSFGFMHDSWARWGAFALATPVQF